MTPIQRLTKISWIELYASDYIAQGQRQKHIFPLGFAPIFQVSDSLGLGVDHQGKIIWRHAKSMFIVIIVFLDGHLLFTKKK